MRNTLNLVAPLAAGLVFGLGLIAAGMTDPAKVLAFLDLAGTWDPSLALVMGGAIAVALVPFAWARRRGRTLAGEPVQWPAARGIDARLLLGGLLWRWPRVWPMCGCSCSPCWRGCCWWM
jgi:uncharacterized membrane protein YedE/YeeE